MYASSGVRYRNMEMKNGYIRIINAKENGIKTSDKKSIERKILQCHLMKYGISNIWYKAAEKHNVNTKEELYNVYFNQLLDMLKNEVEEIKTTLKIRLERFLI